MRKQKIDKLARIAKEQRSADGLPVFDFKKFYAALSPEQQNKFWNHINRKDGGKMCMKIEK